MGNSHAHHCLWIATLAVRLFLFWCLLVAIVVAVRDRERSRERDKRIKDWYLMSLLKAGLTYGCRSSLTCFYQGVRNSSLSPSLLRSLSHSLFIVMYLSHLCPQPTWWEGGIMMLEWCRRLVITYWWKLNENQSLQRW